MDVFDFELLKGQLHVIDGLDTGGRRGRSRAGLMPLAPAAGDEKTTLVVPLAVSAHPRRYLGRTVST
jgi:hypothetical protein